MIRPARGGAALAGALAATGLLALAARPGLRHRAAWRLERGAEAAGLRAGWWHGLGGGGLAMAAVAPAGAAAPPAPPLPVPPTQIAINVASPVWWDGERSFANLARGGSWQLSGPKGWSDAPPEVVASDGAILAVPAGASLMRLLSGPDTGPAGVDIRCRFSGRGTLVGGGVVSGIVNGANEIRFHYVNRWEPTTAWLTATAVAPGSRLADLDCREARLPPDAAYAPGFLQAMAGYRVIRFKDWQQIDDNKPRAWDRRHQPGSIDVTRDDGVPIEDMLELARETKADPWFSMPWNADADYYRRFAELVHERLPPGGHVYVEVANEVWNWSYPVTHQASDEGKAERLTADGNDAILFRLAEKTVQVMGPWERAFADRPGALVRVVAAQHGNDFAVKQLFGRPGLLAHVDALATAPYFGLDTKPAPGDPGLDGFFRELDAAADRAIDQAAAMHALAGAHGKRYIAYEAGQHVLVPDQPLARRIQRDDRMFTAYRRYLAGWRARVGDVLALFHSSSPVDGSGGWGLVEHDGQPLTETPKLRAVREAMAR